MWYLKNKHKNEVYWKETKFETSEKGKIANYTGSMKFIITTFNVYVLHLCIVDQQDI